MKLRVIKNPQHPDHDLILVDENGVPLPQQTNLVVETPFDRPGRVTVTFLIDGDKVRL